MRFPHRLPLLLLFPHLLLLAATPPPQLLGGSPTSLLPAMNPTSSSCNITISWGQPSSAPTALLYCLPLLAALNQPPYKANGSSLAFTLQLATNAKPATTTAQCTYVSTSTATQAQQQALLTVLAAHSPWLLPAYSSQQQQQGAGGGSLLTLGCEDSISVASSCQGAAPLALAAPPSLCGSGPPGGSVGVMEGSPTQSPK